MSIKHDVKMLLESTFDLPFLVKMDYLQQEPHLSVSPENGNEHLFSIDIRFTNKIRLDMTFEPQKYAAQMVRGMGRADDSHKAIFCAYAQQLTDLQAKVSMRINDVPYSVTQYESWPEQWEKVSFRAGIRPLEFDKEDNPDYFSTITKWLPPMMGMSLSLLNVVKTERESESIGAVEGRKYDVTTTKYERSPVNRVLCLSKYGYTCQVCGFNFEHTYGEIGKNFIHVHHIIPVSQIGEDYHINPITDLIPVCPNCHAMLHRENPPMSPDTLRELIRR